MVHVTVLEDTEMIIHPFQTAQIALLLINKTPIKISLECLEYFDVFLPNLAI